MACVLLTRPAVARGWLVAVLSLSPDNLHVGAQGGGQIGRILRTNNWASAQIRAHQQSGLSRSADTEALE